MSPITVKCSRCGVPANTACFGLPEGTYHGERETAAFMGKTWDFQENR